MFLLFLALLVWRIHATRPDKARFADSIGESVTVTGIILDEPSAKTFGDSFTLEVAKERRDAGNVSMIVKTKKHGDFAYGDKVTARGTLALPENFMTDQGTEFDYVSYLAKDNTLYQLKSATVTVVSHGNGNWIVARMMPVKNAILRSFHRVLPGSEADLLAGLNLGEKANITPEFRDDLVTTGTIHMIALSGYNVTVIANALGAFFTKVLGLSVRIASIAGGLCIVLFVIMTGMQSSAIRAGIMALIGLFARSKGRTYDAFRALVLAGLLMILYDPKYLVYDVSFQLSFLATLGIIFITPVLERAFVRIPEKFLYIIPLREAMSVTLGAQLGVMPFILYKMGTLSIIALPANILILPAVPFAMAIGALAGLIGTASLGLAYPLALLTHWLLNYITHLVKFFAKVPYASLVFKHFPLWLALLMYTVMIYWLHKSWKKPQTVNEAAKN